MSHRKRENELFEHYSKLVSGGKDGEDGEDSKNKRNKSTDVKSYTRILERYIRAVIFIT